MSQVLKPRKGYKKVKGLFGETIDIPEEWDYVILDNLTPKNEKSSIRMGPFGNSLKTHDLLVCRQNGNKPSVGKIRIVKKTFNDGITLDHEIIKSEEIVKQNLKELKQNV